jgi:hypothetical protein
MVAALTSFRLDGVTSTSANEAVVRQLAERFGVLTVGARAQLPAIAFA